MEIKKTVGFQTSGYGKRKGYAIHTDCGQVFKAEPLGSQRYKCEGIAFKSLRAVKDSILKGALGEADEDTVEPSEASTLSGQDTWDCVHPCALLIALQSEAAGKLTIDTLDAYGWLDCLGRPDIARAEREIARVAKLKEN